MSEWCSYKKSKFEYTRRYQRCTCTEERHMCKSCVRTQSKNGHLQAKRPQKKQNLLTSWSWTSSLQNCETIIFCCLSHLVCCILLQQPQKMSTAQPQTNHYIAYKGHVALIGQVQSGAYPRSQKNRDHMIDNPKRITKIRREKFSKHSIKSNHF